MGQEFFLIFPFFTASGTLALMTLLFITQKLHTQDIFGKLWIEAWERQGYEVKVLCLENPDGGAKNVFSMGKERGNSKFMQVLRFWWYTWTLSYDRVFIHMCPVWGGLGAPAFVCRRKPTYLWYTHYKMQWGLKLLGWYAKRLFCATPQSLPQYEGSSKKIVTGHGIDSGSWPRRDNVCETPKKLLTVHRLSRSKRLEIVLQALTLLEDDVTLDVYGIRAEEDYADALLELTVELGLEERVTFHGTVPMAELPSIYCRHQYLCNMASETIDKTMLEAMTCGCYPVTTAANAEAIGIPSAPRDDTPDSFAQWLSEHFDQCPLDADAMEQVVREGHDLDGLMKKMDEYVLCGR